MINSISYKSSITIRILGVDTQFGRAHPHSCEAPNKTDLFICICVCVYT